MILEIATAAWLVGSYIYHRYQDKPDIKPEKRRFHITRQDNGTPVTMIYGRTRVRDLIVMWADDTAFAADSIGTAVNTYQIKVAYTVGVPFTNPATNTIHGIWIGDQRDTVWKLIDGDIGTNQTGVGGPESALSIEVGTDMGGWQYHGTGEWLNGNSSQTIVDDSAVATTVLGQHMLTSGLSANGISGMRGTLTLYLKGDSSAPAGFAIGPNDSLPAISVEASSYKSYSWLASSSHAQIDQDSNPAVVLYDLITGSLGKGAIATSRIHTGSFSAAAFTLAAEGHGYSNAISDTRPLAEHVLDLLRQIDAVLFEDPSDGLIHLKLIRADYSVLSLPEVNKSNCSEITNFSIGSLQNAVSRVAVVYSSREHDYNDRDAPASYDHITSPTEAQLHFPGITTRTLGLAVADRELAWRCRPDMKCRALVDRTFYALNPGSCVKVVWSQPAIAGLIFRVARVDRGRLNDGVIALDLLLDNSYVAPRGGSSGGTGGGTAEPPIPPRADDPRRKTAG